MADNINNRIIATGLGEIQRGFAAAGNQAEQSGNKIRGALLNAIGPTNQFNAATKNLSVSAAANRYAIQNLTFQINDVATSLASGISPFRTFTQQAGQFVQLFQQGGGARAVLSGFVERLTALITPTRLAVAGIGGLAIGVGVLIDRFASAQSGARQFDVILQGMNKNTQVTGKQLEAIAEGFHDIGISTAEGRKHVSDFLQAGGDPRRADQIVRVAQDVSAVLGTSVDDFIKAAAQGGPALDDFARRLGVIPGLSKEIQAQMDAAAEAAERFRKAINEALADRNRQLRDLARNERRAEEDRERAKSQQRRGRTPEQIAEENRQVQHSRNLEDINRESARRINEIIRKRNEDNARQLAVFNKQIEEEAQKALGNTGSIIDQIAARVGGKFLQSLTPLRRAFIQLGAAWDSFVRSLAQSSFIEGATSGLQRMVESITNLLSGQFSIGALGIALVGAVAAFSAFTFAARAATAALGPIGLLAAITGVILAFIDWNKAWAGATAAVDGFWTLLKSLGNFLLVEFTKIVNDWVIGPIASIINWIQNIINKAIEAKNALAGIFGGGSTAAGQNPSFQSAAGPGGFAVGGLIRGPGTGTSDSIPVRVSNGEFVVNAMATRMNLPILQAINSMRMPRISSGSVRGFASGGLVSGSGGAAVHIHLGNNSYPLTGERGVVNSLTQAARKSAMLSAGRKPSTA